MMQPDHIPMPALDAPNATIFCVGCGYDLYGLLPHGVCPECAKPIAESIERRRLGLASTEYLNSLKNGALFAAGGLLFEIAIGLSGVIVLRSAIPSGSKYLFAYIEPGAMLLTAAGVWMLTIDDPGLPPQDQARPNKRAMRIASLGLILAKAVAIYFLLQPLSTHTTLPSSTVRLPLAFPAAVLGSLIEFGLWLTLATGLCNYARWLAVRIPDHRLFSMAKTFNWMFPFALVLALVMGIPCGAVPRLLPLSLMIVLLVTIWDRIRGVQRGEMSQPLDI